MQALTKPLQGEPAPKWLLRDIVGSGDGPPTGWPGRWLAFTFIAFLAIAIRLPGLGDPAPDFDEQLYHLAGVEMLKGHMPYIDVWDRKPFGLFVIYAFAALLGQGSPIAYQLLAMLAATVGGCQVYCLSRRYADKLASLISVAIYLIAFPLFAAPYGQSEVFYLPILLGMLQLLIAMWSTNAIERAAKLALISMALGGIALQIKYTVVPICAYVGLSALWRLHRLGMSPAKLASTPIVYASLGLAPTLLVAAGYAAAGQFDAFFYANFQSIFSRGQLSGAIGMSFLRWLAFGSSWLWFSAAVAVVLVMAGKRKLQSGYGLVAGFVLASIGALLMTGNIYVHYFIPAAAGLAIMAAPAYSIGLLNRALAICALYLAVGFTHFDTWIDQGKVDRAAAPRIAAMLRPYVGQTHDCLYVYDGPTSLYQMTGSCLPTSRIYPDHLNNALEMRSIGVDTGEEVRRIFDGRPGAVITTTQIVVPHRNPVTHRIVADQLAEHYKQIDSVVFSGRKLDFYVRSDLVNGHKAE